jgi:hypothetical protein|tara:strand:+ start:621 stop:1076 length:456 start_codon:yes stop_codon:yes gene_type:complete
MLTAAPESFMSCQLELAILFPEHWKKLALDREIIPLDPNYEVYGALEERGELLLIALRDAGKLVGYWSAHVGAGLHYQSTLTATMDMWFVSEEYEKTTASLTLMRSVEKEYNRRGVKKAIAGEKIHKPCGRLYEAFGYKPAEVQYTKLMES